VTRRITGAFFTDAPVKIKALREAVANSDAQAVSMAAHTLKGGCWNVGAARLAELCALLEETADSGNLSDSAVSIAGIEAELAALRTAMDRALNLNNDS
jgi:HPt (histidine-containing phosphotransfer) domain-containing protein